MLTSDAFIISLLPLIAMAAAVFFFAACSAVSGVRARLLAVDDARREAFALRAFELRAP